MERGESKRKSILEQGNDTSFRDIFNEVESEFYTNLVKMDVDENLLDKEGKETLEKSIKLFSGIVEDVAKEFRALLRERPVSKKMKEFLEYNGLIDSEILVMNGEVAEGFLKNVNFYYSDFEDTDLIAVFNLPRPLARFWFKGGNDEWGYGSEDTRGMVTEWGWFYRNVLKKVWDRVDDIGESRIFLERINPISNHDPEKYYYIWKIENIPYYKRSPNRYNSLW